MTGFVAKTSKTIMADNNEIIKDTLKSMAKHPDSKEVNKIGQELIKETGIQRDKAYNTAKSMFEARKILKSTNLKKALAIAIPFYLGAGALVDFANNKQRRTSEPNAKTKNGNEYVKVDMGKKLGGFLGIACEGGMIALNKAFKNSPRIHNPLGTIALSAIGGFALGALADKIANNKAAKLADKNV